VFNDLKALDPSFRWDDEQNQRFRNDGGLIRRLFNVFCGAARSPPLV